MTENFEAEIETLEFTNAEKKTSVDLLMQNVLVYPRTWVECDGRKMYQFLYHGKAHIKAPEGVRLPKDWNPQQPFLAVISLTANGDFEQYAIWPDESNQVWYKNTQEHREQLKTALLAAKTNVPLFTLVENAQADLEQLKEASAQSYQNAKVQCLYYDGVTKRNDLPLSHSVSYYGEALLEEPLFDVRTLSARDKEPFMTLIGPSWKGGLEAIISSREAITGIKGAQDRAIEKALQQAYDADLATLPKKILMEDALAAIQAQSRHTAQEELLRRAGQSVSVSECFDSRRELFDDAALQQLLDQHQDSFRRAAPSLSEKALKADQATVAEALSALHAFYRIEPQAVLEQAEDWLKKGTKPENIDLDKATLAFDIHSPSDNLFAKLIAGACEQKMQEVVQSMNQEVQKVTGVESLLTWQSESYSLDFSEGKEKQFINAVKENPLVLRVLQPEVTAQVALLSDLTQVVKKEQLQAMAREVRQGRGR